MVNMRQKLSTFKVVYASVSKNLKRPGMATVGRMVEWWVWNVGGWAMGGGIVWGGASSRNRHNMC